MLDKAPCSEQAEKAEHMYVCELLSNFLHGTRAQRRAQREHICALVSLAHLSLDGASRTGNILCLLRLIAASHFLRDELLASARRAIGLTDCS